MRGSKWSHPGASEHHKMRMAQAWADPVKRLEHGEKMKNSPAYRKSMAVRSEQLKRAWLKRSDRLGLSRDQLLIYRRLYERLGRNAALEVSKRAQKKTRNWASRFLKAYPVIGPLHAMKFANREKIGVRA